MKTIVISLTRSTERRKKIKEQLNNAAIPFEFFDAIDASTPDFKYSDRGVPEMTKLRFGYQLLNTELACFASHFCVWEKCVELNEPILVFEDNCDLTLLCANTNMQQLFKPLINEYHFIKLFSMFKKTYSPIQKINSRSEIVYYHNRTCGIQSYLISPYAAKQFIKKAQLFIEPVDNYMEKPWRHGIATYSFKPDLVTRAKIKSTIGSNRKIKHKLPIWRKFIVEIFRGYEVIRYKIKNLAINIKSKQRQDDYS